MTDWRMYLTFFVAVFSATLCFLVAAALAAGSPIGETILSAHGILIANTRPSLTSEQHQEIVTLLKNGYLISSDGLISTMSSFYETLVSVLLGSLAVFGVISFLAARSQSKLQIDEVVAERVEHGVALALGTKQFDEHIRLAVSKALEIEIESIQSELEQLNAFMSQIRMSVENRANRESPEEQNPISNQG
jgi:hypothetical protein